MRILVVEDEKRIADFLGRGLESAGYAVDIAQDGQSALDLVHATDYDLITLDMMLPDLGRHQGFGEDQEPQDESAGADS